MMLSNHKNVFRVNHTLYKVIGWTGLILFSASVAACLRANAGGASLVFLFFVLLSIYLIFSPGWMEVDLETIHFYQPLSKYKMRWDEVKYVEIDRQFGNMAFFGKDKVMNIIGPAGWSGDEKFETINFVFGQIKNEELKSSKRKRHWLDFQKIQKSNKIYLN